MERLKQITFQDRLRASREMGELTRWLPPATLNRFDLLLSASAAPEEGLRYFARLHEMKPSWFQRLTRSTAGLRNLVAVFTNSHFLSEEILRHPEWAEPLLETGGLQGVIPPERVADLLTSALPPRLPEPLEFAQFRRRQMLRILIRDVLGLGTLPEITGELTALADTIVEAAYARVRQQLVSDYGVPTTETGEQAHFAVIALGKMGGSELNYSSDIDLMFLYSASGETRGGPRKLANHEFFTRAANQLTTLLSTYTPEGMCYRVDLRLRPDGSQGEVCISLDSARQYYAKRARDWELQMMIKARVAAGDKPTGRALLDFVEPKTYATTLNFSAIEAMSATRERWNEKLTARRRSRNAASGSEPVDVKLARGGIRDIEFLVQCLQRLYGGQEPWVRHGGTMLALARSQDKGFLSGAEYGKLAAAYQFLRQLEHRLQFADDRQTHTLPADRDALERLALRMPDGGGSAAWLEVTMKLHFQQVREIYDRVVHSESAAETRESAAQGGSAILRALEARAPRLTSALQQIQSRREFRALEHLVERISRTPVLERLEADQRFASRVIDLFEHSPYFAEELIRSPELLDEVEGAEDPLQLSLPAITMTELRRWYRREMVRIQTASICLSEPIFDTLARTSELADYVITHAYAIATAEVRASRPPQSVDYVPSRQMWVIALGRLGMREFDLASDADLVFVLSDSDARELEFWTRVAGRLVDLITAYTGEGVLFAVDTRLRPNGASGPLVLTESSFKEYFAHTAEAWEGITYMKSRAVAGDARRAERFLHELQDLDWQRYGQSGRSRTDLRQMRVKIEKETGAAHPLKAGRGGYYDIDFMLMYLRLKGAGIYYKVLNTPERIEVLENLGHLDKATAQDLTQAATFYRALDHGIRVLTGHAESKLPTAEAQMEALSELLRRWTPVPLSDLDAIRSRMRTLFERLFG
ncbi:MAG: glutamine-synthetase adenylyltransferase [Bryobacterales bacterium]|nr:glutamine-synthetase adenylyltransferase [Bryobacterales bacterium]